MTAETIRDEIVLLIRDGDEYFYHGQLSLKYLQGIIPTIGDHLTLHPVGMGVGASRVVERHLAELVPADGGKSYSSFWLLVVEEVEGEHLFDLDRIVNSIFKEDFGGQVPSPTADSLDRSNRDPAYWTFERKELLRQEREARLAAMGKKKKP